MKIYSKVILLTLIISFTMLSACSSGGDGSPTTENPPSSIYANKSTIAPGEICENGGVQIDMGFDNNRNGVLDTDEINRTEYVCNGIDGQDGVDGTNGQDGQDSSSHPFVVYLSPTPNEMDVELDKVISVVFNTEMDEETIDETTFIVRDKAGNKINGTVTYSGIVAAFQPSDSLIMGNKYSVTLLSTIKNEQGIVTGYEHKVYFTTGDIAKVTYYGNWADGGDVPVDTALYKKGDTITIIDNTGGLYKNGYQFIGWCTKLDGTGDIYKAGDKPVMDSSNITLYAIWSSVYSVTYNGNDSDDGDAPADSKVYIYGQDVTVLDNSGELEKESYTFAGWNTQEDGNGIAYSPGVVFKMGAANVTLYAVWIKNGTDIAYTINGITFNMKHVAGGLTFPTGTSDEGTATINNPYLIAETETTYQLWEAVYIWATSEDRGVNKYSFSHSGYMGDGTGDTNQHPVTSINWRDMMIWCNALTEYYNEYNGSEADLDCVYYTDADYKTPIRTSTDSETVTITEKGSQDMPYIKANEAGNTSMNQCTAKGFRLPTSMEWECSARYIDGTNWLYGDHVSGDTSGACYDDGSILGNMGLSTVFSDYAVYFNNASGSCAAVKSKTSNGLGLYDMCGNVLEMCFEIGEYNNERILRGGSWESDEPEVLQVGLKLNGSIYGDWTDTGFRISRSE